MDIIALRGGIIKLSATIFQKNSNGTLAGAAVKISGLRFMLSIFPAIWDHALLKGRHFDAFFVEETIKQMISASNEPREAFLQIHQRGIILLLKQRLNFFANQCSNIIKNIGNDEDFDSSSGI